MHQRMNPFCIAMSLHLAVLRMQMERSGHLNHVPRPRRSLIDMLWSMYGSSSETKLDGSAWGSPACQIQTSCAQVPTDLAPGPAGIHAALHQHC